MLNIPRCFIVLTGDNTGDVTLTQLGGVASTRTVAGHPLSADVSVSASDVGLGNCNNTSDANKPVSSAQQTALDLKVASNDSRLTDARTPTAHVHAESEITGLATDLAAKATKTYAVAMAIAFG